jgi:hypothetical protein
MMSAIAAPNNARMPELLQQQVPVSFAGERAALDRDRLSVLSLGLDDVHDDVALEMSTGRGRRGWWCRSEATAVGARHEHELTHARAQQCRRQIGIG